MTPVQAYEVNNIYVTVQGEGALVGTPMVLVRMHGCPVMCPFCDTKQTWGRWGKGGSVEDNTHFVAETADTKRWLGENKNWTRASAQEVARLVLDIRGRNNVQWVMLTGGEPAMQELKPLVDALHSIGMRVQLETSGTATGHVGAGVDHVCVSPKVGMPGQRKILCAALHTAHEIKWVVGRAEDVERMDKFYKIYSPVLRKDAVRSVQPMSANAKATELCVQIATERGWRISIQTHKMIGVE